MSYSQAEDLSVGRRTVPQSPVLPTSCPFQPPPLLPDFVSPHLQQYTTFENTRSPKLTETVQQDPRQQNDSGVKCSEKELPSPLELVLNMRSDCLATGTSMPKLWKLATTSTHQCYSGPVCSAS